MLWLNSNRRFREEALIMYAAAILHPHGNTHALLIAAEHLLLSSSNMLINADRGIALNAPGFFRTPVSVKSGSAGVPDVRSFLVPAESLD